MSSPSTTLRTSSARCVLLQEVEPAESILDKGKVAAVTGSGREVGRGITVLMAQQGAKVVVADNGSQVDSSGSSEGPA